MRIENEEHGKDGTRFHESSSYEGRVFVCLCGEPFMDAKDLEKHIRGGADCEAAPKGMRSIGVASL